MCSNFDKDPSNLNEVGYVVCLRLEKAIRRLKRKKQKEKNRKKRFS